MRRGLVPWLGDLAFAATGMIVVSLVCGYCRLMGCTPSSWLRIPGETWGQRVLWDRWCTRCMRREQTWRRY